MQSAAFHRFVADHLEEDLHRLLLGSQKYPGIEVPTAVAHIKALHKIRQKIPAWYHPELELPVALSLEQASSQATASYKAKLFNGERMADLTGGLGVDCFFLSQSFSKVDYVEQQEVLSQAAHHNFTFLGANNIEVHCTSAEVFLQESQEHFDLIYIDPARRDSHQNKVFRLSDCQPNVVELREQLLEKADRVLIKAAPMLDITEALRQLKTVSQVWILSVDNECKEVLLLLEKEPIALDEVPIHAIPLSMDVPPFIFTKKEEANTPIQYAVPEHYLLEPEVSILKAGAFRSFAVRYGLSKLHPDSHLYTAPAPISGIPARQFSIEAVLKYDLKSISEWLPNRKANVSTRNFPDNPEQIKKKLRIKDGGDLYLFATTLMDGSKRLILCKKC